MKKPISIRWKILFYILVFSVGLFILLWVFQTVFLDKFYENIRENQITRVASTVAANINDEENLAELSQRQSQDNEACIRIIYNYDQDLRVGNQLGCKVDTLTSKEFNYYLLQALNNNGSYMEKVYEKTVLNTAFGQFTRKSETTYDLIHTTVTSTASGNLAVIMVSARLTPVNATISTLRVQLYYIGFILIIMSFVLSWIMTYRFAKPLEKVSDSAKDLAKGNYDVVFTATGYKEVQDLSDTMNYTAEKLKEVDQMRKDLIANVSHDLRTPLTMIGGYGEMMRDIPEENTPENAQVIVEETQRLTVLVNDLLDFSKLQAHRIQLNPSLFNLTQCIQTTCQRYHKSLHKEKIDLTFEYEKEIEVFADSARIQQVLDNLISNAIHYCGQAKKIIVRQIDLGQKIRIEVQDFGEGIPEDKLDSIWDRYYKIDKRHVRSETGSGIGLSIVKEILILHEVQYGVTSKLNEGSTFYFELKKVEAKEIK